ASSGCPATAATAGPGPLPAPDLTSASAIAKKIQDDRELYWIADAISGICQRHAGATTASPDLHKGQTRHNVPPNELSEDPARSDSLFHDSLCVGFSRPQSDYNDGVQDHNQVVTGKASLLGRVVPRQRHYPGAARVV